ncbi:hypothetical protein KZX47_12815 [Thermus sp. SYSU G05001]|uniref:Uncharacterized protein n=1 Tax=Thermus brevis TaxID=2862456 RepID=A0ABS7A162_9DEIN|nr:hypothetical protein [Thermus brevis]MBW6396026.1 hypothetical protein [Thermus brevis]
MLVLEGALARGGRTYRVRLQRSPTPDPLAGAALWGQDSRLYLTGALAPWEGGPVAPGEAVRLELAPQDLLRRGGMGRYHAVFLTHVDGEGWGVAAQWPLEMDFRPLPVFLYASRAPTGEALVTLVTHEEAPEFATLSWGQGTLSAPWEGLRRGRDSSPAFLFLLPREAEGEVEGVVRKGERWGRARTTLPPPPPLTAPREVRWRLPWWLPPTGVQGAVLEAIAPVLSALPGLKDLSPATAAEWALDRYAHLFAASPATGESEEWRRARTLAVGRGLYLSRPALEAHLRALGPVSVSDRISARVGFRRKLDGTWRLDGSVQLGSGSGGSLEPGRFEVAFQDLDLEARHLVQEVERLRPAGTEPVYRALRTPAKVSLKAAHAGVRELGAYWAVAASLAKRRKLDGTWRLDGSAKLRSGMAVRDGPAVL